MRETLGLPHFLESYIHKMSVTMTPAQKACRAKTENLAGAIMQISPEQGQFMTFLMELLNVRQAIEVGTYTGYSALCMALGMPKDGRIISCDINTETSQIAQEFWQQDNVAQKIELRLGPAVNTLEELLKNGLNRTFDFAFIDADKENYDHYYELILRLLKPNGVVMIDNVLWSGRVAQAEINDRQTKAIRALNKKLQHDPRVHITMLPLSDGVTLARKL